MAKEKHGVPNKHLNSRLSFLYQAAILLSPRQHGIEARIKLDEPNNLHGNSANDQAVESDVKIEASSKISQRLLIQQRVVASKSQIRLSPAIKHTVCRRCDSLLIDGSTCTNAVENSSKGGKKPWADVWVRTCKACGMEKRFPLIETRQPRRARRLDQVKHSVAD